MSHGQKIIHGLQARRLSTFGTAPIIPMDKWTNKGCPWMDNGGEIHSAPGSLLWRVLVYVVVDLAAYGLDGSLYVFLLEG
jgi:hypothetical protein